VSRGEECRRSLQGRRKSHQEYDAFGDLLDTPPGLNQEQTRTGFTGQQEELDLRLVDMGGRIYDPLAGRFMSPDPIMQAPFSTQGSNRYSYVFNDPINKTDPSGFMSLSVDGQNVYDGVTGVATLAWPFLGLAGYAKFAGVGGGASSSVGGLGALGGGLSLGGSIAITIAFNPFKAQAGHGPESFSRPAAGAPTSTGSGTMNATAQHTPPVQGHPIPPLPSSLPDQLKLCATGGCTAENEGPWAPALGATMVLVADDATGIGVADDAAIPIVLAGATVYELTERTFITYTLTNPITHQVYAGRSSGYGSPSSILRARMARHHMVVRGFDEGHVDQAVQGYHGYPAVRGREQQLIDSLGGVGSPNVANPIRGVAKSNPAGRFFHWASNFYFGPLHPYTGF